MLGPVYAGTGVPFGLPFVVLGDGEGSYWRLWYRVSAPSLNSSGFVHTSDHSIA